MQRTLLKIVVMERERGGEDESARCHGRKPRGREVVLGTSDPSETYLKWQMQV